jgi:hypothetical protein
MYSPAYRRRSSPRNRRRHRPARRLLPVPAARPRPLVLVYRLQPRPLGSWNPCTRPAARPSDGPRAPTPAPAARGRGRACLVRPCDMSVELHSALRDLATCNAMRARRDHAMPCTSCSLRHVMPCAPNALHALFDLCETAHTFCACIRWNTRRQVYRFLLTERSFCADTRAGMAHAH